MKIKTTVAAVALFSAAGLALSACGSTAAPPKGPGTETINTELWSAPTNFNPATASSSSDVTVARLGFDTLLRQGEQSGYIGGLAQEWKAVSASEYNFTIGKGATCSDGTPITASVIAASLKYLATAQDSGARNWKNQAFGAGDPTFAADDASNTLKISLSKPYSEMLGGVTLPGTGIICPAGLADLKGLAAGTVAGAWSGPYTLTKNSAGVSATYGLRSGYNSWPKWTDVTGAPAKTINISVSTDSNTSANLLSSGGLDVTRFYDSNADRFTKDANYSYATAPSSAYSLVFNQAADSGSPFVNNQALRAAVAQAIDVNGFNQAGLDGLGKPMTTVNASTYQCALNDPSLLQKPDKTAALKTLKGTTIRLLAMSNWNPAVDYLAESLRAAGATVTVSALDPATWQKNMRTQPKTWDLALQADPATTGLIGLSIARNLGPSYSAGGVNASASDNPEGVKDYDQGITASDPQQQCTAFQSAQRTILQRIDMAPLVTDTHFIIARKGFAAHVFSGYWDISALRITG